MTECGVKQGASGQGGQHGAKAQLKCLEIAEPLRESATEPGGHGVGRTIERSEAEVCFVAKAIDVLGEKVEIIEEVNRHEGIHAFENEITGLEPTSEHG